jgi:hypothetical protein
MRVFFSFNLKNQAALCHSMAAFWQGEDPDSRFAGLYVAKDYDLKGWLTSQDDAAYDFLDSYEELVDEFVDRAASVEQTQKWEQRLGRGLRDIIVADRQFGREYTTGGRHPHIGLTKQVDHEFQQKAVCGLLDYYEKRLTEFKPDLVFLPAIAAAHAVALVHVANYLGIPAIRTCPCLLPNRIQLCFNLYPSQVAYSSTADTKPEQLDAELLEYLERFSGSTPPLPAWKEAYLKRHKALHNKGKLKLYWRYGRRFIKLAVKNAFRSSESHYDKLPLSDWWCKANFDLAQASSQNSGFTYPREEPFVLYPLHVDPEASTMVLAPAYTDQLAVVEALSKSIPLSHKLYVKDHQSMVGKRPRGYYDRIRRLQNVRLISPWENTQQLMAASSLTVSITGSCCWEAAFMNKPTLLLGNPLYPMGNAIAHCTDMTRLPEVIFGLISKEVAEDGASRIDALASWSVPGDFMALWRSANKEAFHAAKASVCKGIENMLRGLTPRGNERR